MKHKRALRSLCEAEEKGWFSGRGRALLFCQSLVRENIKLREALEYFMEATEDAALNPPERDPEHWEAVEELGKRIGYGALMTSASASWRESGGGGWEFTVGPCRATLLDAREWAIEALNEDEQ